MAENCGQQETEYNTRAEGRSVSIFESNPNLAEEATAEDVISTDSPKPYSYRNTRSRSYTCCITKEYYSEYANLIDSLHITPRLMIQKKRFRVKSTYGLNLSIRNNGLYPRLLKLTTDSPDDTKILIINSEINRYLETDQVLNVKITVRSMTARNINRPRHIFIHSFHPNITFQVPIIVVHDLVEPSVSEHVILPSTVPRDKSYYEMIIYNPTKEPVRIKYRTSFKGLVMNNLNKDTIHPRDYTKLLLIFEPNKLQEYRGFFNVKFGVSPPRVVMFEYTPKSMGAYLSRGHIAFGHAKFTETIKRSIIVCNESPHPLKMNTEFVFDGENSSDAAIPAAPSKISNKIFDEAISMHSVLLYDFDEDAKSQAIAYSEEATAHFNLDPPEELEAYSSYEIDITFKAVYDDSIPFPEDIDPPYFQRVRINFCFTDSNECVESHFIILDGEIDGIQVEVFPKVIDFRKIYLGEEHCAFIKFLNVDGVTAKVKYKDCMDPDMCGMRITPTEGFHLEPCERGIFHLSFYTITPARFSVSLRFKVENGMHYNVVVKAIGQYVQLRTFPQLVEFGSIPIAVPQKRFMLLMNPLAVPITLQVTATDDGEEQPLVFNIRDTVEMLPITIKDPIKDLQRAHDDLLYKVEIGESIELSPSQPDQLSEKSYIVNESVYSLDFEEDVMEPVPTMAMHLLKNLKKQKIFDKSETDKRVIQEALQELLNTNYFSIFNKHNNFIFMDWNSLPSDPREVYCDNEIIYLRPNTGRSITILIIPNRVGYYHRSLTVRICPAVPNTTTESSDDQQLKTLIKSEYLCSKLWFEYNCCTPDIEWINFVDLTERIIYAGEEYSFDMLFTNTSSVGGFLHFDVIPNEMSFRDGNWKFYIGAKSQVMAKCMVVFHVLGKNKLSGLLQIVGDPHPYSFHLFGSVLPTAIRITPQFVHRRIRVYELNKVHFYIDNSSPTNTKLSMSLKDIKNQYLTTKGALLDPKGQSTYTTLVSLFTDPDLYQNILYIDLQFDHIMEIPITFLVEGVPLYFEPDIRDGFDAGLLFTDPKENFDAHIYTHRFPVKVINRGFRTYRIGISRLKTFTPDSKANGCSTLPLTTRFEIVPKLLELQPNTEGYLEILIIGYEEGLFSCDFILNITDLVYPQRKTVIKVVVTAKFAECELCWDRKQLIFKYTPSEPLKERSYMQTAELINYYNLCVENISLEAVGPFRIKELYEHNFQKQINVSLNNLERKEIFVLLNKASLKQLYCRQVEGRINVSAIGKAQKYLPLKLSVLVPELHILQPELVLFDRGNPFNHSVPIINHGCSSANFKWKRLEVSESFIGDDDAADMAAEVLSQILRTLEYNFTCEEESNLTLRYQQCRCQFKNETESGHLILDIIDEIIEELDLAHKRFCIHMEDVNKSLDNSDAHSSTSFVRQTIENILGKLNIESSQQVSEQSSDYCFSDRFIYFYEKTGQLEKLQNQGCELHLPHIRRGHEMKSVFELDVLGGRSQVLSVTLVNLAQKVRFHKDNIYLNIRPWYESYNTVIRISNVIKYPLYLLIMPRNPEIKAKRLIDGYAKIMQDEPLYLEPLGTDKIKLSGILGLNENFNRTFCVLINNSATSHFRLRGQGVLPILNMTSGLPKVEQSMTEIMEEYSFMCKIYNYDIFKSITEADVDLRGAGEEEDSVLEDVVTTDFSELSESEDEMSSDRRQYHDLQLFQMVHTYVMVNNNQEVPNAVVLNQMLVTERYLHRLRLNPELYATHQKVYENYTSLNKTLNYKPSNLKHFTVQPLPCEHLAHVLDLGPLTLNTLRRFELKLHFFGPGKLIAAARTSVRVPGLYVDFSVKNHEEKKFLYWAEKCTAPEFFKKGYRNMWERLMDADTDPRVKHAHSFDFDKFVQHQRDITDKDRRLIEEYYNSLNPSVYPDHKHHFTLAKIFTAYHSNFSGVEVRLVGLFKPESKYYERDQRIVDYIYIDLHMGPTLPVLLRGVISA